MAREDVWHLLNRPPTWGSPLDYAVLLELAKYYNRDVGFAWPAAHTIAERVVRSPHAVRMAIKNLENRLLVIRLGLDKEGPAAKTGTNRYVPIWRVEDGVQQQLREVVEADAAAGYPLCAGAQPPMRGRIAPLCAGAQPPYAPAHSDLSSTYGSDPGRSGTGTAAAAPQLPGLLTQIRQTLVEEILRKRREFFATAPNNDNFRAVTKAAIDVLADPALAGRLVKGYDPTAEMDVRDAVRGLCDRRHIDWGKPSYDVIYRAIAWAQHLAAMRATEGQPREHRRRRGGTR